MKKEETPKKVAKTENELKDKLPYKKPKLTHYGTIRKLTLGATPTGAESGPGFPQASMR